MSERLFVIVSYRECAIELSNANECDAASFQRNTAWYIKLCKRVNVAFLYIVRFYFLRRNRFHLWAFCGDVVIIWLASIRCNIPSLRIVRSEIVPLESAERSIISLCFCFGTLSFGVARFSRPIVCNGYSKHDKHFARAYSFLHKYGQLVFCCRSVVISSVCAHYH